MNFKMYLSNVEIESIPLSLSHLKLPGYLEGLVRHLKEIHEVIITSSKQVPEFYIEMDHLHPYKWKVTNVPHGNLFTRTPYMPASIDRTNAVLHLKRN